jgi:serine/threonine-protein kinase
MPEFPQAYNGLGWALWAQGQYGAAEEACRKAIDLMPEYAVAYAGLGRALAGQRQHVAAAAAYRKAIDLMPEFPEAYNDLGFVLEAQGKSGAAEEAYRKAIDLKPDYAEAHKNFGHLLVKQGKHAAAANQFEQALLLNPEPVTARQLCGALVVLGRGEVARVAWRQALDANPSEHESWSGYPELCLFLRQEDEYRRARTALLGRFGTTADPFIAERTGRAGLLRAGTEDELRIACALTERATASERPQDAWAKPYFLFAKGLADYRRGRLDSAISLMEGKASGVLGPAPGLVLAMAKYRQGQRESARKVFTVAVVVGFDWDATRANDADAWLYHVLRREAEATILPNLPAFLRGTYKPQQDDERMAMRAAQLATGRFQNWSSVAQLCSELFVAEPKVAETVVKGYRFYAARAAVLAGCGQGKDADRLDDKERASWRRQALDWLRQDLSWWDKALKSGNAQTRTEVRWRMQYWQADDALAGVRTKDALARLPEEERKQWESLWSNVGAMLRRVSEPE